MLETPTVAQFLALEPDWESPLYPCLYLYTSIFSLIAEGSNEILLTVYFLCIALEMEQSPFTLEFVSLRWNQVYKCGSQTCLAARYRVI